MTGPDASGREGLIAALLHASPYPHAVRDVELRQTHISWILLAGEYAYKIKKPVQLAFVDFSTLERRRHDCFEEWRLNRRFAPGLYLDVVSICGSPEAPVVDGKTAAIEYAVRMRRFPAEDELGALIERGAVHSQDLDAFGQRLAEIHDASPVCTDSGSCAQTLRTAQANAEELEQALKSRPDDIDAVLAWVREQESQACAQIERRRAAGRVRECHGDLHAGNIVRLDGELTAFDCVEFDAELRRIDVINDVAFLAMDLVAHHRIALAYAFLNGWLERSGDYDGMSLLRFFAVYRALVRAKVAALRDDQRTTGLYIGAAASLVQRGKPLLMLTCGLSGSGKTWLSGRLMTDVGAIRVRSDVERKRLAGLQAHESSRSAGGQGIYTPEFNERAYARLFDCARIMLLARENVVVDAAFLKQAERLKFIDLADVLEVPVVILHCVAPEGELRERLQARQRAGRDASEADVAVMQRQVDAWQEFTQREQRVVTDVRTDIPQSVDAALRQLRSTLQGTGDPR